METMKEITTKKKFNWELFVYRTALAGGAISFIFSLIMALQGKYESAWMYMFISWMNGTVAFDRNFNK